MVDAKLNFWNLLRQIVSCLFPSLIMIKLRCGNVKQVLVDSYNDYIKLNFSGVATLHFISRLIFLVACVARENHKNIMCQSKHTISSYNTYIIFVTR